MKSMNGSLHSDDETQSLLPNSQIRHLVSQDANTAQYLQELNDFKDCLFNTQVALECVIETINQNKSNKITQSKKVFLQSYDQLFNLVTRQQSSSSSSTRGKYKSSSRIKSTTTKNRPVPVEDEESGDTDDSAQCVDPAPGNIPISKYCKVMVEDIKPLLNNVDTASSIDCKKLKILSSSSGKNANTTADDGSKSSSSKPKKRFKSTTQRQRTSDLSEEEDHDLSPPNISHTVSSNDNPSESVLGVNDDDFVENSDQDEDFEKSNCKVLSFNGSDDLVTSVTTDKLTTVVINNEEKSSSDNQQEDNNQNDDTEKECDISKKRSLRGGQKDSDKKKKEESGSESDGPDVKKKKNTRFEKKKKNEKEDKDQSGSESDSPDVRKKQNSRFEKKKKKNEKEDKDQSGSQSDGSDVRKKQNSRFEKKKKNEKDKDQSGSESDGSDVKKKQNSRVEKKKKNEKDKDQSGSESDGPDVRKKQNSRVEKKKNEKEDKDQSGSESDSPDVTEKRTLRGKKETDEKKKKDKDQSGSESDVKRKRSLRGKKEKDDSGSDSDKKKDSEEKKSPPKRSRRIKIVDKKKTKRSDDDDDDDSDSDEILKKQVTRRRTRQQNPDSDDEDDIKEKEDLSESDANDEEDEENSDGEDSDVAQNKKKGKKKGTTRKRTKSSKKRKRSVSNSEEEEEKSSKSKKRKQKDSSDGEESDQEEKVSKTKKRKRILVNSSDEDPIIDKKLKEKAAAQSSSSDEDDQDGRGRKAIRKILGNKRVSKVTKKAEATEKERRKRIEERQKMYNELIIQDEGSDDINKCPITRRMVLDAHPETKEPYVEVNKKLITKLKPHQVEAVKFMWDCLFESVERQKELDDNPSAGCILAHCMGLGKTLSVITLLDTVMHADILKVKTCLVLAPLNTVLNWQREFEMWLDRDEDEEREDVELSVVNLTDRVSIKDRPAVVKFWHERGGVMIMGYELFRILATGGGKTIRKKSAKQELIQCLTNPGPDIVICDEGHLLKNDNSALTKTVSQIKTRRRVVLTGTPLQNNLNEYYTMLSFVKPNLLGNKKEFSNRFANPILNGQHSNSTQSDVKLMKRRAHVLYKTLDGCVQRRDYSSLIKYLPPKLEFVIMVRLTEVQRTLYTEYLKHKDTINGGADMRRNKLFADQQVLYRIWTHPYTLKIHETIMANKMTYADSESSFLDDETSEDSEDERRKRKKNRVEEKKNRKEEKKRQKEVDVIELSDEQDSDCIDFSRVIKKDSDSKRKSTHHHRNITHSDAEEKSSSSPSSDNESSSDPDYSKPKETVKQWSTRSRRQPGDEFESLPSDVVKSSSSGPVEWWHQFYQEDYEKQIELSGKLTLLMHILKKAADIGDKVLLFSQSLLSLTVIENFLAELHRRHLEVEASEDNGVCNVEANMYRSDLGPNTWIKGLDYERMDGSTAALSRKAMQDRFNDFNSRRLRLFLISTKAGGLGINMVSANRVVIFDVSWNPSNDMQSIFRCYRFGQTKPVYIYRLAAQGTMEEKIYDRQVIKQSLAHRVIDEQQIERHFSDSDLNELYTFNPDIWDPEKSQEEAKKLKLPRDRVLADLIEDCPHLISGYHEHDSLLANLTEEELTDAERLEAWKEYEDEKTYGMTSAQLQMMKERELFQRQMREQAASQRSEAPDPVVQISFGSGEPFAINMIDPPRVHYEVIMNQLALQFPELTDNQPELQKRAQLYMPYCHQLQRKWQAASVAATYRTYNPNMYRAVGPTNQPQ